jgi:hypothetical protein
MAKAHIVTKGGTKVSIEGSQDEIVALIQYFEGKSASGKAAASQPKRPVLNSSSKSTPLSLVSDLIDGGFFKKPKELGAIKLALEEQGHFYPVTSLSPTLLRLVRKKQLRRIKDKKRWLYVG